MFGMVRTVSRRVLLAARSNIRTSVAPENEIPTKGPLWVDAVEKRIAGISEQY